MNDGQLLLDAIVANPSDDVARWVFADWAEERFAEMHLVVPEIATLRLPGRYELHPPLGTWRAGFDAPWRLYWVTATPPAPLLGQVPPPPKCPTEDCASGWQGQVFLFGRWQCWHCAAREAGRRVRGEVTV